MRITRPFKYMTVKVGVVMGFGGRLGLGIGLDIER